MNASELTIPSLRVEFLFAASNSDGVDRETSKFYGEIDLIQNSPDVTGSSGTMRQEFLLLIESNLLAFESSQMVAGAKK
jgi:hypothetical protein